MTGGIVTIVTTPNERGNSTAEMAIAIGATALTTRTVGSRNGTRQCFSLPLRFALYPRTKLMAKYPVRRRRLHLSRDFWGGGQWI